MGKQSGAPVAPGARRDRRTFDALGSMETQNGINREIYAALCAQESFNGRANHRLDILERIVMGLFDKPRMPDGKIKDLSGRVFYLRKIEMREVNTSYGPNTALDLYVAERDPENGAILDLVFSGFSAGIKQQALRMADGDLPAFVEIIPVPLNRGKSTTELAPRVQGDHTPITAEQLQELREAAETPEDDTPSDFADRPLTDDDIPF